MRLAALAGLMLLSGCMLGPHYVSPTTPVPAHGPFIEQGAITTTPLPADWWRLYQDPVLDWLVIKALAHNTDIRQAVARLEEANAVLDEARGGRLPTTSTSASYAHERSRVSGFGAPTSVTTDVLAVNGGISYEVDLFGRVSRSVEAARGDAGAAQAALDATRTMVVAETTRSYARACANAAQALVARQTVALQAQTVDLTTRTYQGGRQTQRDVDQAQTLYAQAQASVAPLEAEQRASLYALATLTGVTPQEADTATAKCNTVPRVSRPLPIGDGASLLARRPDVRRAERQLAADTARIGVQSAALYPTISLGGNAGLSGTKIGNLGKSASFSYSLGPLISWNFPNFAIARARVRQASAVARASLASFDGAVLTALQETEQALARLDGETKRHAALVRAAAASDDAARLSRIRFQYGADSFFLLLDAERTRAQTMEALAQSDTALIDDQITLFKALGGGWEGVIQ